jgi:SAM-dependent methyltransferase
MWDSENRKVPSTPEDADGLPHTPSRLYDEDYFLNACEGHERFDQGTGANGISSRLAAALTVADVKHGERILDIGCGRGEAVLHCARSGAVVHGVDYAADALRIARRSLAAQADGLSEQVRFLRGDARRLPFEDGWFDKLLMFDLVEHLYPWELRQALREAWRVLVSGGQLIVHTAPNRWYYRFGYPLYRSFERLRGRQLPRDPRDRFPCHHLHVNEQDVRGLRHALSSVGFKSEAWLENVSPPLPDEGSLILRLLLRAVLDMYPVRWVFRNDIFAIAYKQG